DATVVVVAAVDALAVVVVAAQVAATAVAVVTAADSPQSKHHTQENPATSRSAGFFDHWHSGTGVGKGCCA
uniref:hypothetical protein n=1 Tax=Limnohabitans sp. TaxID=1907725 RepID=UPI0038B71B9D